MPLDSILVTLAVTAMFATFAATLCWSQWQTRKT